MNIIELTNKIEDIVIKNNLVETVSLLKNDYAILKSSELEKSIKEKQDEGRVLKLGILGRVKAGKSSLLNALIFDGDDVLPKAATPMTAALTILEYGEETKADVEFFTQEDIDDIKQESIRYEKKLENIKNSEYKKLKEIKLKKEKISELSFEDENELNQKALDRASKELRKDDALSSSYDQYQRIKESGMTIEDLNNYKSITADNLVELNNQLLNFVGANGKYMPFTKSVTLTINQESLKNIQIIDTPGVNDPVTSREDRTKELLKDCDVVLIVSPSGQFLSSEDLDLMDRITSKEGIRELYLVASQVDNQLYGSEKTNGNGILNKVLDGIEDKLTEQQRGVLSSLKQQYPDIKNTFDTLIENKVILSSGISYNMMKSFENQMLWDENMKKVWENLNFHYKDFFTDKDTAISNLKKLANIEVIQKIIDDVRNKKDAILAIRKEEFIKAKYKALLEYKESLEQDIKNQIQKITTTDINEIRQKKEFIGQVKSKATDITNDTYSDLIEDLEYDIKTKLQDKLAKYFKQSSKDLRESESTETERWTTKEGGFLGFFQDTVSHSRDIVTVKAGAVRSSLENLTEDIESTIDIEAKKYITEWRKKIYTTLISILRKEVGDDMLDVMLISNTIRKIIGSVIFPEINYNGNFPKTLKKSGTLKESEAKEFINEAYDYISNIKLRVKKDIKDYIQTLVEILKKENIGEKIFANYSKEILELQNAIENRELSLDILNNILKQFEAINE
ncbi:dynamin family protein [Aliarcobacter cryaerophilus]|uniref:dynamin family protein n=1 Tax=Aliarcobacter cryaerophilus TaxID=28198 RepID=UPI003DA29726